MLHEHTLIVLGATGDLTGRLLLPALGRLWQAGELDEGFQFVGAGPQNWDRDTFRDHARSRLTTHAPDLALAAREAFLGRMHYQQVDVLDPTAVAGLLDRWGDAPTTTVYLALPTDLLAATVTALGTRTLPTSFRIAVEKPFGTDLGGAISLNAALARAVPLEDNIFRIDHVLGMDAVAQLPSTIAGVRSDGSVIEEVSILWEETLALEGRAAFYDGAGALKDLLQNHLLQILCMVTMDPAGDPGGRDLSKRRLAALRCVQVPTAEQARTSSRRARYGAGRLATTGGAGGEVVPDYSAEAGVDPARNTETFAEVELAVSNPKWAGTRFVLRAGKAMGRRRRGVRLRVRPDASAAETAEVWIDVDRPETGGRRDASGAGADHDSALLEQIAYTNVLRSLLSGSNELSVSAAETELAWQVFTPILTMWAAGEVPLEQYPAGAR